MRNRSLWLASLVAFFCTAATPSHVAPSQIWLWAWEQPQDLRYLESESDAGVAYLAATLSLEGGEVRVSRRRQPLRLAPNTARIAVVRIEVPVAADFAGSSAQLELLAARLMNIAEQAQAGHLQLDFDARLGERPFYRALLQRVRGQLPSSTRLSMTALASWCFFDDWLDESGSPLDGIVPMVFSMGGEGPLIHERLRSGPFLSPVCRSALGVHARQPWPPAWGAREVFVFDNVSWTNDRYRALRARMRGEWR